jgi:hypothetical protein
MTRTSRRLKEKPTHNGFPFCEERSRSRSSFRPSEASTHRSCPSLNRSLRLASISAASAAAAPKGKKHYSLVRGPTQLRPSTRKDTQMAKSTAKPGSIPSYVKELEKLSAELKAAEEERAQLEAQWRQKYMQDVEELIEFARRRKHPWAEKIEPENEAIVKETFLVWLYRSTEEQRKIRALETNIDGLKLRIRKAKKMLRLLKDQ